jgi:hypothetical protein
MSMYGYQPPPWSYPQGPYNPWVPPPYPTGCTPPPSTGNPIRDLKRAIKFYKNLQKEDEKEKKEKGKTPSWKERVDMYILLAIMTPIIIPLYSIMVHRLWEIAK